MLKILLVILFCITTVTLSNDFPIVELKDIPIAQYKHINTGIEKTARRTIYTDGNYFYKIWDTHFWRCQHFLKGIEVGFYDQDNTPLVALIYDGQHCRGYITRAGIHDPQVSRGPYLIPIAQQSSQAYISFYNDLLQRTRATGYAYIDLTPANIVLESDKIRIIDLEPLLPLASVDHSFLNNGAYPADYRAYIRALK